MVQEKPNVEAVQSKEATPQSILKELKLFEWIIVIIIVGYFIYLNSTTSLVININDGNETRVINGIPNPPHTVLYEPNDYVPKSNVSNTQTFVGILLVAILIVVLLAKRIRTLKRATIQEAIDDIAEQLIKLRNMKNARTTQTKDGLKIISDIEEIELTYNFLTRYKTIEDRSWAFRYSIHVNIFDKTNNTHQYKLAYYHPWSRYFDGMVSVKKELSRDDKCSKCGSESDEKMVIGSDLMKFKQAKEWTGLK